MSIIPFENSFASNPKSKYWSNKNLKQPREVYKSTHSKYLFDCEVCGHEFEIILNSITCMNQWCGFCANKKLCNNEKCKMCLNKSFASHPRAKFWSSKNKISPREVFKSTTMESLLDT